MHRTCRSAETCFLRVRWESASGRSMQAWAVPRQPTCRATRRPLPRSRTRTLPSSSRTSSMWLPLQSLLLLFCALLCRLLPAALFRSLLLPRTLRRRTHPHRSRTMIPLGIFFSTWSVVLFPPVLSRILLLLSHLCFITDSSYTFGLWAVLCRVRRCNSSSAGTPSHAFGV